jgi:hypothetical protein
MSAAESGSSPKLKPKVKRTPRRKYVRVSTIAGSALPPHRDLDTQELVLMGLNAANEATNVQRRTSLALESIAHSLAVLVSRNGAMLVRPE